MSLSIISDTSDATKTNQMVTSETKQNSEKQSQTALKVDQTLAQRQQCRPNVGPALDQPSTPPRISVRTIFQTISYKLEIPQFTT